MTDLLLIILTVAGLVPLYADLVLRIRRGGLELELERFREPYVVKPVASEWSIRVLHPNKAIERLRAFIGDIPLPLWDSPNEPHYVKKVPVGGGANFRIPRDIQSDDAVITIKDGDKKLRKRKFSEIAVGD